MKLGFVTVLFVACFFLMIATIPLLNWVFNHYPGRAYHNSGWVNCPARDLAKRYAQGEVIPNEIMELKGYVRNIMTSIKDDDRILMWELYNEPGGETGETGETGEDGGMAGNNEDSAIGYESKQFGIRFVGMGKRD